MRIHRSALAGATDEQLRALRDNVLKHWQHIPDGNIVVSQEWGEPGDALIVTLKAPEQDSAFVIGIEPDGYTHS